MWRFSCSPCLCRCLRRRLGPAHCRGPCCGCSYRTTLLLIFFLLSPACACACALMRGAGLLLPSRASPCRRPPPFSATALVVVSSWLFRCRFSALSVFFVCASQYFVSRSHLSEPLVFCSAVATGTQGYSFSLRLSCAVLPAAIGPLHPTIGLARMRGRGEASPHPSSAVSPPCSLAPSLCLLHNDERVSLGSASEPTQAGMAREREG